MSSIEVLCWKNTQYSRPERVEVVGIPSSVEDKDFGIMEKLLETCHCLKKQSDRNIIKFLRRKDCEHAMQKSELRKLNHLNWIYIMIYINETLYP